MIRPYESKDLEGIIDIGTMAVNEDDWFSVKQITWNKNLSAANQKTGGDLEIHLKGERFSPSYITFQWRGANKMQNITVPGMLNSKKKAGRGNSRRKNERRYLLRFPTWCTNNKINNLTACTGWFVIFILIWETTV